MHLACKPINTEISSHTFEDRLLTGIAGHPIRDRPSQGNGIYQETPQSTQSVRAELVEAHRPFDKLRANGKMEVVTVRSIVGCVLRTNDYGAWDAPYNFLRYVPGGQLFFAS